MAFRSNGPVMVSFPAFRGVTRRIILLTLAGFFGSLLLGLLPGLRDVLVDHARLRPLYLLHGQIWELLTYPYLQEGLLNTLFVLMTVWFFGSTLEDDRGSSWLTDYFLTTTIGGAILASLLTLLLGGHVPGLETSMFTAGLWPAAMAMIVAFAVMNAEQEVSFNFIFRLKAKYLAAIYVLIYLALAIGGGDRFGAVLVLANIFCGYLFLRFLPRRGLRVGVSERWYGLRNAYYRRKRQRAARKFTVYMKKQGQDVSVDMSGDRKDPNDKRWMN